MEVEAFRARREKEAKFASYAFQLGAGIGVTAATGGAGLLPYLAGAGTFTGVGIALDKKIHANIKAGDWPGALDLSSYYLPFVGAGRNSWDAWHANQYWRAAGHASLLGVEVLGLRGAGRVRWGGVKIAKGTPSATQAVKGVGSTPQAAKAAESAKQGVAWVARVEPVTPRLLEIKGTYLNKPENVSELEKFITSSNKLTEGQGILSELGVTPSSAINTALYYPSAAEQGASIFRSIIQGHMFRNGNKRTAVIFWKEFRRLHKIQGALGDEQLLKVANKVAEGNISDVSIIAEALSE